MHLGSPESRLRMCGRRARRAIFAQAWRPRTASSSSRTTPHFARGGESMKRLAKCSLFGLLGGCLFLAGDTPVPAGDKKGPSPEALTRTRDQVKMLDDLYKTAVVSITNSYVEGQASTPAAMVAQD